MTVAGGLTLGSAGVAAAQAFSAAPGIAMQPEPYPPLPNDPWAFLLADTFDPDADGADDEDGAGRDQLTEEAARGALAEAGLLDADGANGADNGVPPVQATAQPLVVEPVVVDKEPAVVPDTRVVTQPNNNNNGWWPWWQQPMWGGTGPGVWTTNDTENGNGPVQPVVAPVGAGGNGGILPVQNAMQEGNAVPAQLAVPGETEEEAPEEELEEELAEDVEEEPIESDFEEGMGEEAPGGMMGAAPAGAPAGPGGPQLPFTGAPLGVAAAGAGLLAVALGCTLMSARRRRASGAE